MKIPFIGTSWIYGGKRIWTSMEKSDTIGLVISNQRRVIIVNEKLVQKVVYGTFLSWGHEAGVSEKGTVP